MTRSLKISLLGSASALLLGAAAAADCPAVTVAEMGGLTPTFPQQFELAEFQQAASCTLGFADNPAIADLNARIQGNADLPALADRLPSEPLVVAPYAAIGSYGGTLLGTSRATESGTSDLLSVRHVNLVRYSDDLQTLVPNIARAWDWNEDFTELTFHLRAGHKWSDGEAFTADDIVFWYNDLILNSNIYESTPGRWLFGGEPAVVEALDDTTVVFRFPVPAPGLLNRFAVDYGQPFQPAHFLGQFMDKHNPDAAAHRAELGFSSEGEAVNFFYGPSDWKDIPTPLLRDATKLGAIGRAVVPTLESHIVIEDNAQGRRLVANPYFHMVDTAGNQLPYISEIAETYVLDREVNMLRMLDGQVHWKQQAVFLDDFPVLMENSERANITVALAPAPGSMTYYAFNRGHTDPVLREVFGDARFSRAMSIAMDRDEINEIVFLGQGRAANALPVEPVTVGFVSEEQITRNTEYDVDAANALLDEMGLTLGSDGVRRLPDGRPFVLRLTYASQGGPVQMHELVRDYWGAVGVRVDLREVSSDEYRAAANANEADILTWKNDGVSAPAFSQDPRSAFPPFGDFFNPGPGIAWAEWKSSDGASGVEPPADVLRLWDLAERLTQIPLGRPESDEIGRQIVEIHLDQMIRIGTVGDIPEPYMHHNSVQNLKTLTAKTYDYYWTYPYRAQQWFLAN